MSPPSCAKPVVTNSESVWLQHKELLHQLYINENRTLKQVKDFMESEDKLPALRLHDYEVALRDVLKLRKNLRKEDWHSIGIHLSNRKRQGKESEVLWNSVPLAAKKVRKDVLRNRKMNQLCYRSRTAELPVGVVIRTPPGSPSRQLDIIGPPEAFHLGSEQVIPASHINLPGIFQAGSISWDVHNADLEPAEVEISRFRHLRKNIPFNRFMSELLELSKSHLSLITLSADRTWVPGPRLFGGNPSLDMLARVTYHLSNRMAINWKSDDNNWFLNWLGVSADFKMLRLFFSVKTPTVYAAYEELCDLAMILTKPTVARVLFEIRDAVKKEGSMNADAIVGRLRPGEHELLALAARALESDARPLHPSKMRLLFLSAAGCRDIAIMRLLVNAVSCSDGEIYHSHYGMFRKLALIIFQVCVGEHDERKDGTTLADYIQLLIQGRILLTSPTPRYCCDDRPQVAIRKSQLLTIDELIMVCPPVKRRNLYSAILPWSNDHMTYVSRAGVFTAASEGSQSVRQYLLSCKQNEDFQISVTIQECLLFAAGLNDTQTASVMLQLGVNPRVPLLMNNQELYHKGELSWNPMIVAAAAGSLETLQLLGGTVDLVLFLKSAPVFEVIHPRNYHLDGVITGSELGRLNTFRRVVTYSKIHGSDDALTNGTMRETYFLQELDRNARPGCLSAGKTPVETIAWIRTIALAYGMVESLDKEIIAAAMFDDPGKRVMRGPNETYHPCDVLMLDGIVDANLNYHEGDMDLLQLSIRAQCGLKFVEFLISMGLRVHSRAAGQSGNTMLHDALLSWSDDRSKIVHLLLREGAEYKQCGEGLTVLEASLHGADPARYPRPDDVEIFTRLFEAGAPVQQHPRPQIMDLEPLICRLLEAGAEDRLIIRVLDAGADLTGRIVGRLSANRQHYRPLDAATSKGRENLARELIQRGADVHAPADDGPQFTALQAACLGGCSLEFVEYLVKVQGANVNEAPGRRNGHTALQGAASHGSLSVAEFLLENGADVNAFNGRSQALYHGVPDRCRALDIASYMGRLDMVEFLLKAGGRSGTGDLDGAIRAARTFKYYAVRSILLDWKRKHRGRIVQEEVEWQRQNTDAVDLLWEV